MAAPVHAVAQGSRLFTFLFVFLLVIVFTFQRLEALTQYGRAELLKLGKKLGENELYAPPKLDFIPPELQRITGAFTIAPLWPRRRTGQQKQKPTPGHSLTNWTRFN